jgi:hypothetical protein
MASLHHHAAVLLTFALIVGCGGDRTRAGAGTDTTGAAAVTPDSAATPVTDTAAKTAAAPAATDTSKKPPAVAPAAKPPAKSTTTGKKLAAHDSAAAPAGPAARDTARAPTAESAKSPPTSPPPPPQKDTSSAPAETPLRDAYHQAPHDTVTQAVYDGWKQFNLNCARCHGEDVLGTTIAPHLILSLKPDGPINTKELFVQTVCAGRPAKGMPAWCALGLDLDKINDIYLYVKGRSDAKISPGRPAVKKEG